ncbi:MAG: hypothetical protein IT452_11480, partial [Planctomycetia bacterium]|nr:hypothetical protein [Planctomycetia bacterium]
MTEPPVPPRALDALAGAIGKARATPGATPGESTFGWVPGSGAPATIGRFRVVAPIGRGGMGVVYEAVDPLTNKAVALKSLAAGPASRLTREGEAIARLDHPAIVPVLETGEEHGRPFLVMELVHGQALDEAWSGWDLRRRVEALKAIAEALGHAHG